jgi:hypothetical protein
MVIRTATYRAVLFAVGGVHLEVGIPQLQFDMVGRGVLEVGGEDLVACVAVPARMSA